VNLTHYLDGAGSVDLFPPKREYKLDLERTQAKIETRMEVEGISMEEAFARETRDMIRRFRQSCIGQVGMTVLVTGGMVATVLLAIHNVPTWLACIPHAIGWGSLFVAQHRYHRRIANGEIE
jgi:hypothetical protein